MAELQSFTLVLVAAVFAATSCMLLVAQRYQQRRRAEVLAVSAALLACLLVPQLYRDAIFALGWGVFAYALNDSKPMVPRLAYAAVAVGAAFLLALGYGAAGGGTGLLLTLGSLWAVYLVVMAWRELARLEGAEGLQPGQPVDDDVDFGGRIAPSVAPSPPKLREELRAGAWQIEWLDGQLSAEPATLELRADRGLAHVDLSRVKLVTAPHKQRQLRYDEARLVARALGMTAAMEPSPGTGDPTFYATVRHVDAGREVYVVGRPEWEESTGKGYRDSTLLPVFGRTSDDETSTLYDLPARTVWQRARWNLARALVWGGLAIAIAITQMWIG